MTITKVICNGVSLSIGDRILVEFKPIVDDEETQAVTKEITITSFKPFDDSSEDVWIVGDDGELYADENFKSIINK